MGKANVAPAPRAATHTGPATTFIWNGAMLEALEHCLPTDRQHLEAFFGLVGRIREIQRNDLLYAFGINDERLTMPRSIFDVQRRMRSSSKDVADTHLDDIFTQLRQRFGWKTEYGRSWLSTVIGVAYRRKQTDRRGQDFPIDRGAPPLPTRESGSTLIDNVVRRCRAPTDRDGMSRLGEVLVSLAIRQQNVFIYWYALDDDRLSPRRPGQAVERFGFKNESAATEYVGGLWLNLHANGLPVDIDEPWLLDTLADVRTPGRRRRAAVVPRVHPSFGPSPSEDGHPDGAPDVVLDDPAPPPPAPPEEAPADPFEGSPDDASPTAQGEEDMAGRKSPVPLTRSQYGALEECRKVADSKKPPDNLATWARKKGYANQWADLRRMGIIVKNDDGSYAIAKTPVVLKERSKGADASVKPPKGAKKAGRPEKTDSAIERMLEAMIPTDPVKQLHAAVEFFKMHPDLLKLEIAYLARRYHEIVEEQGWQLELMKDGAIRLVEAK